MTGIPTIRGKNTFGYRLAIGVVSALGFASPAVAETKTLSCEGEITSRSPTTSRGVEPWSGVIDVDYSAATISIPSLLIAKEPADITDRVIGFKLNHYNRGNLDRLTGELNLATVYGPDSVIVHARCRPATQKF